MLLQYVAVCCSVLLWLAVCCRVLQCVAVCCSVLQCVAVCCSVLQGVAACCSVVGRRRCVVAMCCSVLQWLAKNTPHTSSTALFTFASHSVGWWVYFERTPVCVCVRVCVCVYVCVQWGVYGVADFRTKSFLE